MYRIIGNQVVGNHSKLVLFEEKKSNYPLQQGIRTPNLWDIGIFGLRSNYSAEDLMAITPIALLVLIGVWMNEEVSNLAHYVTDPRPMNLYCASDELLYIYRGEKRAGCF